MRKYLCLFITAMVHLVAAEAQVVHIVFTSDLHYGITRPHFRGEDSVSSSVVNKAQVAAIQSLSNIDAVIVTGDIANREEKNIEAATISWQAFLHDYQDGLKKRLLVTPGNHDASNASAHPKIMFRDAGAMTGMIELEEKRHIDTSVYNYHSTKLNYSRNLSGIHCMFINIWPDSANRIWMEKDLSAVAKTMPALIFTHDPPQGDPKHFTNPENPLSENLIEEIYKDTLTGSTVAEQKGFITFLKNHPHIKAYFHGHENYCEMYSYHGLPVFRSDSPMKGKVSRNDETLLSFQLITIDQSKHKLTVRECLWNKNKSAGKVSWGKSKVIAL